MKKQLLLVLSFVVVLFFGCSEKSTKKTAQKGSTPSVVSEANNTTDLKEAILTNQKAAQSTAIATPQFSKSKATAVVVSEEIKALRKSHEEFLNNSPFKKTMSLSKTERKAIGLAPNKYYEQEWELTMNPQTGSPDVYKLKQLRSELQQERDLMLSLGRTPGDASDNNWIERGPNNVGGRVRAVMFDPNDAAFNTVFAGGVSGGLWKNSNISSSSSAWTRVNVPENLSVSKITYDPNNTNIFYLGTGESYVAGDVNGSGVWKSIDGGTTWTNIFGGITGPTTFQSAAELTINSPAGVAGNYVCYPTTAFGSPVTAPITENIVLVDDGTAPNTDACESLVNGAALNGKIALIRRGTCTFVSKILAAQNAGAIGVIMMNNVPGTPVAMGGDDPSIIIPSLMVSMDVGDLIEAAVNAGTVSGTLNPVVAGAFTGNLVPGQQHINDVVVRNNGGSSELYVAAGDTFYSDANQATYLGGPGFGLYKSIDGGTTFTEVTLPLTANGNKHSPNDIEIGSDNKIWVATTNSVVYSDGGGKIFSSVDGVTFTQAHQIPNGRRTELAVSSSNPNKIYALVQDGTSGEADIYVTTNGFSTVSTLPEPPSDGDISATDFCRDQAFYNLMIEVDPTNDAIVYIGGINLHRSSNSGSSWSAISGWTTATPSNVHSDQHGMAFKPGNSDVAVFGNDGGVYYGSNLSGAAASNSAISSRNIGLNVTQFYSVGVAPTNSVSGLTGEYFAAGAQDNGTQYFENAASGVSGSSETQGGDGAFTMFDQGADKYYISNYVYNANINYRLMVAPFTVRTIDNDASSASNGAFIAPMVLDSNQDILYSDYSTTTPVYQIRRYKNLKSGLVNRTNLTNALLTASPTAFAVSPHTTTSTTLLVGTRLGKLLKVLNANATATWSEITGPQFVGSVSDIEFGATENDIFVTMHNYNVVSIWYSADGGATWLNKEGNLPDLPVKCILQNPLKMEEVIVGTELGVWYTNNFSSASPTWNQSYNGMSNVKVVDLDLRNDNTVFAATYGRGIFSGAFTAASLSSDSVALEKGIQIFPNPSNGIITVSVAHHSGDLNVEVCDLNGRKILSDSGNFTTGRSLNLQGYAAGVYVIKIQGVGLHYNHKVVLK